VGTMRRIVTAAMEPKVALSVLAAASCLGASVYLALVLFTGAQMEHLYFALIILMCAVGIASLYILRTNATLAITVYAWLAGICLASMMIHDALRGERYDHLLWVYPTGVAYLVIYVGAEHAFFYALGASFLGALLGLCESRPGDGIFYALMPLALWAISASVSDVIRCLRRDVECVAEILEISERAER
jgi:hypothetical protein